MAIIKSKEINNTGLFCEYIRVESFQVLRDGSVSVTIAFFKDKDVAAEGKAPAIVQTIKLDSVFEPKAQELLINKIEELLVSPGNILEGGKVQGITQNRKTKTKRKK